MYYVYLLKSERDQKLYIGRTDDLKQRLNNHASGKVKSTRHRRPMALIFYEAFRLKDDAVRRERYFKTSKGKSSIKQIIRESLQ